MAQSESEFLLELNPETANLRTKTFTSLTDTYDVPLFTDQLEALQRELAQNQAEQDQFLIRHVFNGQLLDNDADQALTARLFSGSRSETLLPSSSGSKVNSLENTAFICSIGALLLSILLFIEIKNLQKRKRKTEIET